MTDNINEVKELLEQFKERKNYVKVFEQKDDKVEFLEHCLACIEEYQKDIIYSIMIDKISVRRYSRLTGFSRNFIAKERDKTLDLLSKFFYVKYQG